MGGFRRVLLLLFGLAGTLCLAALVLPWVGPYQREATALMGNTSYAYALQALLVITALGLLATLLRALFSPRKRKDVVVSKQGGDQITVTTAAISSQATHVVEEQGNLIADKVRVSAKGRGGVDVSIRVRPRQTVNIAQEGTRLHDSLLTGLSTVCGDKVRHVNIQFLEAEAPAPAQDVVVERVDELEVPASVYERAQQMEAPSDDITVSVAALGAQPAQEAPATEAGDPVQDDEAAQQAEGEVA